ncbi:MAG TPA: HAMP domain-containing sensor histidine kinase [Verrucomicrobiae bacterium]|nr:HAMP domain-containing sensor histidine kinase [Verrucomicrobiae bacterium]
MKSSHRQWLKRLAALLEIPAPDPPRLLRRIETMERDIMLPVKAVFMGMILYSFHSSAWFGQTWSLLDVTAETVQFIFWFYILANVLFAAILLTAARLPLALVQWTVVTSSLVDGLLIAAMSLITGGLDSILFWLFLVLIIRNAASVPPGFSQLFLNFEISVCYVLMAVLDVSIANNLDDTTRQALDMTPHEELGEPFVLRVAVLWLTAICCYGAQVLLERQRLAVEEAEEFAAREGQLRSAGRLAAEFAHQIKNPLAIINNAVFSLQRSLRDGKTVVAPQVEIIQEEVARADRVVTQIMGYAQLSEGHVEKLNVVEELDRAIAQVFPPAVPTGIKVRREYGHGFPPLLMQRGHLSEILVNLFKNAREAVGETGNVFVTADCHRNHSVEISIRDDGAGVPPDKIERIFEAYYTTKEHGTGLGLAIVKHNVELYGGTVRVESGLGKGAKFILTFPAKALMKLSLK